MNRLFYGDNLHVLQDTHAFPDASVDLIYLDPPFNSKRDYNLLFKSPVSGGRASRQAAADGSAGASPSNYTEAQITAFEDSWHWGEQAEREFDELLHQPNTDVAEMMKALRAFLGENDMGMSLYDHGTKGCADGLLPEGVSLNQGGESTVSFLMALLAMIEEYELEGAA